MSCHSTRRNIDKSLKVNLMTDVAVLLNLNVWLANGHHNKTTSRETLPTTTLSLLKVGFTGLGYQSMRGAVVCENP